MTNKQNESKATEQAKTASTGHDDTLSARDALALATNELDRLACVLEDFAESARTMINVANMNDEHREYAAFLRNFERILNTELEECCNVETMLAPTLRKLRADDEAARNGHGETK